MINTTPFSDRLRSTRGGGLSPTTIQRIEGAVIATFAMTATVSIDAGRWWFPLAIFLVFDLSAFGYMGSPAVGAFWYNAIHTYTWPASLGMIALLASDTFATWISLVALGWAFHVAVDRMLGYGLKLPDGFTSTHLGRIGKGRERIERS